MKALRILHRIAVLGMISAACDELDTRNCPPIQQGGDPSDLEYELLIPSDCPVPIGEKGELKRAGARISDFGASDFAWSEVTVRNSDGIGKAIEFDPFTYSSRLERFVAEPATDYAAATGSRNLDDSFDYGFFRALESLESHRGPYGEVKITYARSVMANVIDGTPIPPRNASATWRAVVTGGTPPYNYYWYRDGALVGTSEYYTGNTGTQNFGLRVAVVDQTMTERAAVMPVDVGGVLTHIDGPDWAYLYTDDPFTSNATWTAVVQGGTAPFTYQWYRDGYAMGGNTPSHTEHIDERVDFTLRVKVQDATGKSAIQDKFVRVGQKDCPTCPAY